MSSPLKWGPSPSWTSDWTDLSCVSRPFSADLTEALCAWPIAFVMSVIAADMSADRTDCDACAFKSSIVLL